MVLAFLHFDTKTGNRRLTATGFDEKPIPDLVREIVLNHGPVEFYPPLRAQADKAGKSYDAGEVFCVYQTACMSWLQSVIDQPV